MKKVKYDSTNDEHIRWLLNSEDHRFTPESISWVYENDGMAYTPGWDYEERIWRGMTRHDLVKFERFMSVLAGNLYHRNMMAGKVPIGVAKYGKLPDGSYGLFEKKTVWIDNTPYIDTPEPWYVRFIKWCSGHSHANSSRT